MKNYSAGGNVVRPFDEYEVYFSTYKSHPTHNHHSKHGGYAHMKAEEPMAVPDHHHHHHHCHYGYGDGVVAKGLDQMDVDCEASDFIAMRHRKLELAKFMSMAPLE